MIIIIIYIFSHIFSLHFGALCVIVINEGDDSLFSDLVYKKRLQPCHHLNAFSTHTDCAPATQKENLFANLIKHKCELQDNHY